MTINLIKTNRNWSNARISFAFLGRETVLRVWCAIKICTAFNSIDTVSRIIGFSDYFASNAIKHSTHCCRLSHYVNAESCMDHQRTLSYFIVNFKESI